VGQVIPLTPVIQEPIFGSNVEGPMIRINVLAAGFLIFTLQSALGQNKLQIPPPIEVPLLELQAHPSNYDNCRVRVRGEYGISEGPFGWSHGIALRDPKTKYFLVDIWLDYKDDPDIAKECRTFGIFKWMDLIRARKLNSSINEIPWLVSLPVSPVPANQMEAVRKFWKKKRTKPTPAIVVGRFDFAEKGRLLLHLDGTTSFISGFGPNTRYPYRIVVETIVILKKGKTKTASGPDS
jgi:hypothetical protein